MRGSSQQGWLVSTVRKLSRGPDLDSAVPAELVAFAGRLNNALRRLESDWAIFVEAQRHSAGVLRQDWLRARVRKELSEQPLRSVLTEYHKEIFRVFGMHAAKRHSSTRD